MQAWTVAILAILAATATAQNWRPVVLMHGVTASKDVMEDTRQRIMKDLPGIHVNNVEIGNGKESSLFTFMGDQVDEFRRKVQADPKLRNGFNVIGHSQGGLIVHGYISRFNNPPVHNFISWAAPHAGQYGIPALDMPGVQKFFDQLMAGNLSEPLQRSLSFASYWRSPMELPKYLQQNLYLADVNNERAQKNAAYRKNWIGLNRLQLLWSPIDIIIKPPSSGIFETFAPGQTKTVTPLKQSDAYKQDWLGLQTLDKQGKLFLIPVNCAHGDFPRNGCVDTVYRQHTLPWLKNTLAFLEPPAANGTAAGN